MAERQRQSGSAVGFKQLRRAGPEVLGVVHSCGEEGQYARAPAAAEEQGSGRSGPGVSLRAASVRLMKARLQADPNNPPKLGGGGVSDGDGTAVAERRSGRSRGRRGAVLLIQSGCA